MQALFAVAFQSNNSISSMIILGGNDNSWDTLDLGDIEKDLAAKLSDDDIRAILFRINAVTKLKTLKLTNCVNISGIGLGPLAGSQIIEQIDLSLAGDNQSPAMIAEHKLSCDQVLPILRSIIVERGERRNCALKHIQFPFAWRELGSIDFRSFLLGYNDVLVERRDNICLNCSARLPDEDYGWLNIRTVFGERYSRSGIQNCTCYKCLKHYCGDGCWILDEDNNDYDVLNFCEKCERNYCYECSASRYCDICEVKYCSDCVSMNVCDGDQCSREFCCDKHNRQCQDCHRSFCTRDSCNGKIGSCNTCKKIVCEDCRDECVNCSKIYCRDEECTRVFKQICKICGEKSCFTCVEDSEKDTKIQTCEKCGTSYCHFCQVDDGDEHELIKDNDCIECMRMIALSLHREVHKPPTSFDWSEELPLRDA